MMNLSEDELKAWLIKAQFIGKDLEIMPDVYYPTLGKDLQTLVNELETLVLKNKTRVNGHSTLNNMRNVALRMQNFPNINYKQKTIYHKKTRFRFAYYYSQVEKLINKLCDELKKVKKVETVSSVLPAQSNNYL